MMTAPPSVSFELFPPPSDEAEAGLQRTVDRLAAFDPAFVSVTYGAAGSARARSDRIVRALLRRGDPLTAAHITSAGATRAEVDELVRGWAEAGLRRIVALRGDAPDMTGPFRPHDDGYRNAAELVAGLRRIADFDISVAAYPESHPDSPTVAADLDNLKRKLDAGAARAITQYFFEAETFLRFRDRAAQAGIVAPIVPGILPITHFAKVVEFSQRCGASVPAWLAARFEGLDDDAETRALVAATTACELCRQLLAEGANAFHFYTLNRSTLSAAVCRMLGLRPRLMEAA
jgi:methylenetetrahydrofolate reductase (NADPH)